MDKKSEFKQINNDLSLIEFLEGAGHSHNYFHHYTNLDSLIEIIKNKTLLLTKGDSLKINDQHEWQSKGCISVWEKTYICSFAFGKNENMAMWGLYCLPWEDAVRISIPKKYMEQWINNIKSVFPYNDSISSNPITPSECKLTDIIYINREGTDIYWNDTGIKMKEHNIEGIDKSEIITGLIKSNAWKYENEVRILVRLSNPIIGDRIAITIPDEVINNMVIQTGPYFHGNIKERIDDLFTKDNYKRYDNSSFTNLVKFRSLCSLCRYDHFLKKTSKY